VKKSCKDSHKAVMLGFYSTDLCRHLVADRTQAEFVDLLYTGADRIINRVSGF
jgi:hypothetical protein